MKMQIFHFTVRGMPTYEREREYFLFVLKTKNSQTTTLNKSNPKTSNTFQNLFFFKAIRWVRVSFPKRKTTSTLHAYAIYFFLFFFKTR